MLTLHGSHPAKVHALVDNMFQNVLPGRDEVGRVWHGSLQKPMILHAALVGL